MLSLYSQTLAPRPGHEVTVFDSGDIPWGRRLPKMMLLSSWRLAWPWQAMRPRSKPLMPLPTMVL